MRNYKQLTSTQRYQIAILKKAEKNQHQIAVLLGVSGSTIWRELKRNQGKRGYRPN
ncbi:MAG: helix-turn-helix domain-containing protein [Proteobacteria bacterium]|nr:helix-turn-helix domain-containing protein [Pseudomonadota bacterium]